MIKKFNSRYVLYFILLVFNSCKTIQIKNRNIHSKVIYVVHTKKNCFDCFNKLNLALFKKYKLSNQNYTINYVLVNSNFISSKTIISKFNKIENMNIEILNDSSKIKVLSKYIDDNYISPYLIVDSIDHYYRIDYKELFDKEGVVNKKIL